MSDHPDREQRPNNTPREDKSAAVWIGTGLTAANVALTAYNTFKPSGGDPPQQTPPPSDPPPQIELPPGVRGQSGGKAEDA